MFITLITVILCKISDMNIAIGNDHAGTSYKFKIVEYLEKFRE